MTAIPALGPLGAHQPAMRHISVDPTDFEVLAELACHLTGASSACIRLKQSDSGAERMAFFPPRPNAPVELPAALIPNDSEMLGLPLHVAATGFSDWAAFRLIVPSGRSAGADLGLLGLVGDRPLDLSEAQLTAMRLLARILTGSVMLTVASVRAQAARALALVEGVADVEIDAASDSLKGLLRFAAGVPPTAAETMALRIAGLAELQGGQLALTQVGNDILSHHGFETPGPQDIGPEDDTPAAPPFQIMARLRIGEVNHDIGRSAQDKLAFRLTGSDDEWQPLQNTVEEGWPDIAAEIIAVTRDAVFDYVRMHMIHVRDAGLPEGQYLYDLYGLKWVVRGGHTAAQSRLPKGEWVDYDAHLCGPDATRERSALGAVAVYRDLEERIGKDVRDWARRIAQGSSVTPVFA